LDFLTGQKTINAQYYSTLLNEKVKPAIRSKRRNWQNSVCFLQNNVRPHTAALMKATSLKLKWDVLPNPPYSPDLASSDYHLFGPMKWFIEGKRFRNNYDVIAAVQSWIHKQQKTFFETGIKKLPERSHKRMVVNRDYVKKQCVKRFHFVVNKFFLETNSRLNLNVPRNIILIIIAFPLQQWFHERASFYVIRASLFY
jgi:hypothetical protein